MWNWLSTHYRFIIEAIFMIYVVSNLSLLHDETVKTNQWLAIIAERLLR